MRSVGILGVPLDLGAGRRGTDMGPSAVRLAGLADELRALGIDVTDHGGVPSRCRRRASPATRVSASATRSPAPAAACVTASAASWPVAPCRSCWAATTPSRWAPSPASPPTPARSAFSGIDAHADLNTAKTSPSGNVHGMPLAALTGTGHPRLLQIGPTTPVVKTEHVAIVGLRSVDPGEKRRIRDLGISVHTMSDIDERGMSVCMAEAIERVTRASAGFHLSFDMDVLDPEVAPGVGTPVPGGLTYREAHYACERVARSQKMLSMEVVEVNPILDDRNRTGRLAVELILSTLGKTIY